MKKAKSSADTKLYCKDGFWYLRCQFEDIQVPAELVDLFMLYSGKPFYNDFLRDAGFFLSKLKYPENKEIWNIGIDCIKGGAPITNDGDIILTDNSIIGERTFLWGDSPLSKLTSSPETILMLKVNLATIDVTENYFYTIDCNPVASRSLISPIPISIYKDFSGYVDSSIFKYINDVIPSSVRYDFYKSFWKGDSDIGYQDDTYISMARNLNIQDKWAVNFKKFLKTQLTDSAIEKLGDLTQYMTGIDKFNRFVAYNFQKSDLC